MSNDEDYEDIEEGEEEEYEEEEEDTSVANPDVVQKYKFASNFANKALQAVLAKVAPGVTVLDLCTTGDTVILDEVAKVYNKNTINATTGEPEKIEKGIAFPTSVSVNNIVCHFSPGEEENKEIAPLVAGDVIRIDLGCHVDGYCAVVADTVVVGGIAANPKAADVITAAHTALDIAIKALRPDTKAYEVTEIIDKVAKDFGVNAVEGALSHRLNRYIIDGVSCIANKDYPEGKVRDITLGSNEVWGLDVVLSTGPGKLRQRDLRTMIFKRSLESNYQLKLQASRDVFNEVNSKFQTFPFSIRHLDQKRARIGITECLKHDVVVPYPVLYEKDGEIVAHVKATVLVLGTKIEPVTGMPLDATVAAAATKTVQDPKVLQWKAKSLALKKKNKGKKKAAKAAAKEPAAEAPKK